MSTPVPTVRMPTQETSSSAPTQPLVLPSPIHQTFPAMNLRTGIVTVLTMLVLFGLLLWYLSQTPGAMPDYVIQATRMQRIDFSASIVWLNLAAWASLFALWLRRYSLLIGGCLAGGIGMGEVIRQAGMLIETQAIGAFAGGLAVGLLVLYVLGQTVLQQHHQWPLYLGGVVAVSGAGMVTTGLSFRLAMWLMWIPLVIFSTALYLGTRRTERHE